MVQVIHRRKANHSTGGKHSRAAESVLRSQEKHWVMRTFEITSSTDDIGNTSLVLVHLFANDIVN